MKTTPISTMGLINSSREMRTNLQFKIAQAQKEANTGRHSDVGLSIGYLTERTLSLRHDLDRLQTFKDTNAVASSRLELTQTQLDGMASSAQEFLTTLMAARSSPSSAGVAVADAKAKLKGFTAAMNTAVNGAYLFAGVNTDVKPLGDYFTTPASGAQTAVSTAFAAAFPGDVEDISAADMTAFLDGAFASLFDNANWTANWSQASDQNITSRISTNERIETGTNANEEPFRLLASVYTMVADLPVEQLGEGAYLALMDKAMELVGRASNTGLTDLRATLGTSQGRIKASNERIDVQKGLLNEHVVALEGVDPYEAQVKVNALLTQLETAYALTAKLQNLSLLKYI